MPRYDALSSRVAGRIVLITLLIPLIISLGFRFLLLFNRWFDPDEFEHLHYGWMVMNGYLPYRDFFENDPPGLWYLLAPLAKLFDESPAYLFASRFMMLLLTAAIFLMVYRLASTGQNYVTPIFSIFLLNMERWFVLKTLEVRPDQFIVLGWLLGVWFLIRSAESIPRPVYAVSGLSVGMGLLFSAKALFAIASLGGALLLLRPIGRVRAPAWKDIALFGLMSVIPLACLFSLIRFRDEGWLPLFVEQVFSFNFAYPVRFSAFRAFYFTPVFLAFAGLGTLLAIHKIRRSLSELERRRFVLLTASMIGAALAHFVFIPAPYAQSLLPCLTFLAILGGEAGGWINGRLGDTHGYGKQRALAICLVAALVLGSIHALASIADRLEPLTRTNREYVEWLTSVLRVTSRSDAILDGKASYIFRPQASFYGHLGAGVRKAIKSGTIKYDIPERCAINGCPVVVLDKHLLQVAPWIVKFVRANYAPSTVKLVYFRQDGRYRDKSAPGQ